MTTLLAALCLSQTAEIRIACVGASTVAGVGTTNPMTKSFPSQLAEILGPNYKVGNFGNSGSTLSRGTDHPYWGVPEFAQSQYFQPNIVVIFLGTNDATPVRWPKVKDSFVPTYKEFIRCYQDLPSHPKVYACIPGPTFDERKPQLDSAVMPLVRQAAREAGARTIDLYSPLEGRSDLYPDKLHPNDAGARIMAETIAETIETPALRKQSWKLVSVDSEEAGEGPARAAIDGDEYTYWHTNYSEKETKPPHTIVVDLGKSETYKALRYLPRQDGGINGRVKDFELYLSENGSDWGSPVLKGSFKDTAAWTRLPFAPKSAHYFKFVALSEQHGQPWSSVAELDLVKG